MSTMIRQAWLALPMALVMIAGCGGKPESAISHAMESAPVPATSSTAEITWPVNPHTSIWFNRNAGPHHRRPRLPRYTISRLAGLMKARTGTRATIAVSASLTTCTGPGSGE